MSPYFKRKKQIYNFILCLILGVQVAWSQDNLQVQKQLDLALQHYGRKQFTQALEVFRRVQERVPTSPMPHVGAGLVYAAQGRLDVAIEEMQQALALQPNLAAAHKELGDIFWRQRRFDRADHHYREAIALDAKMEAAYIGSGLNDASQRDFANALEHFRRAIEINPKLPSAHHSLGQTYTWMGNLPKAIEAYQVAIQLEPNRPASYYELGIVLMRLKNYPKAVTALEKVVKLNPRHKSAHYNLARAYAKIGKTELAELENQLFEKLHKVDEEIKPHRRKLEGNPEDLKARYAMVQIYAKLGWIEDALEQCELMLSIRPNFTAAYIALIQIYISQEQLKDAFFWAQRLTEIQPTLALGYSHLGLIAAKLGRGDVTIEAYQKAISLDPDSPSAYNNLAWFYADQNTNLEEAIRLCQKAIALEPKPAYIDTLAQLYYKQGRYDEALQEMSKVIQLAPDNPKYKRHWKVIRNRLNWK